MNTNQDNAIGTAKLPSELTARLQKMIWRVRRIVWLRGLLATAAVWLGCALAIMAVDAAVLIFSPAVRWGLSVLGLAAGLATAWSTLVRPLSRRLSITRMARVLETRHPELQERISSAIELLSMGGDAASRGSEQLIALLAHDAQADMRAVQPRREFSGRSIKPALMSAGMVAVVFGLLFAAWPRQTMLLFKRAVAPYEDFANLQGEGLAVEPGDVVRLQGEELSIRLQVKGGGAGRAEVRCLPVAGPETVERMRRTSAISAADGNYEIIFPNVTASFRYRIRYGAGLTRFYQVNVLPPPATTRLTITCHNPAYTKQPSRTLPENVHDIVGVAGTRVEIDAEFNRRADGVLFVGQRRFPGFAKPTPGATWSLMLATNMADRWSLALRDDYGFTGRVETAALKVIPDRVPVVTTLSPYTDRLTLPPYGQLACAFTINEDFDLSKSEFVISIDGGAEHAEPLALQASGKETWTAAQDLDLARLQLGGVRKFKVWLRVFDTLPPELGGPQKGESRPVVVTLDVNAKRIEDQLREEQKKTLQELLKAVAERLGQSSAQVSGTKAQVGDEAVNPAVMQALSVSQERVATAEDLMKRAANLCEHSFFAKLAPRMHETAARNIEPARAQTAGILFAEAAKRPDKAVAAAKTLAAAAAQVQELLPAIDELDKKQAAVSKTAELAQREEALAEQAGEKKMTQAELDAWKKAQAQVSTELAAQVKNDPAALKQTLTSLRDQIQTNAVTARSLAARQEDLKEKTQQLTNSLLRVDAARKLEEERRQSLATQRAEQQKAADQALEAAHQAEAAATQAEKAAMAGKEAQDARNANQPVAAKERTEASEKQAQQSHDAAEKAAHQATEAAAQAEEHNLPDIVHAAEKAERAADMVKAADDLLREAAQEARQAEQQPADAHPPQVAADVEKKTAQATDLARDAARMAREAAAEAKGQEPAGPLPQPDAKPEQNAAALEHQIAEEAKALEQAVDHAANELQALQQEPQVAQQAQQLLDKAATDAQKAADKETAPGQQPQAAEAQAKAAEELHQAMGLLNAEAAKLDQQAAKIGDKAAPPVADAAAFHEVMEKMDDARADLNKETPTARDDQEQQAARTADEAAQKAGDAAEKAKEAAAHAEEFARDRQAADATGKAAQLAEDAAKQAEKAATDANQAAQKQQAEAQAEDARDRKEAAQAAQEAAKEAEQAAEQAQHAAQTAEAAAQQQEQGHAEEAGKKLEESKKDAQAAMQGADKARQDAQQAAEEAKHEQGDKAEQGANQAKEAAEMANRSAELAKEADEQTAKAEHLPNEQRQAQTQQAADKAHQAAEMAKQAQEKAHAAGQKAAEEHIAEQQAEQAAAKDAGTPQQIQEAAKHAGQEAQQAAKMAQAAAAAAQQAVEQSAQAKGAAVPAAAKESEEAAQMADQAAALAERAEQRIEKTEGKTPPDDEQALAENKRAAEEAAMSAQLARDAAEKAHHAARTAQQEMEADAQAAKQGAKAAAEEATAAANEAGEAEKNAHAAGSGKTEEASQLGKKSGEMAREAGEMVKDAMQNAEKSTAEGDQQAYAKAEQAAAKAGKAAEMAGQASAKAHAAEQASANAKAADQHAGDASRQMSQMADQQAAKQGQGASAPPSQWRTEAGKGAEDQKNRQDTMNLGGRSFIPFFLKNLGFPESEWARYKGKTNSEAMEEMLKTVPPEYRELVRRYFVELSREGSKASEGMK